MIFTILELQWFHKNSYNLAVTKSQSWPLTHLVRIIKACLTFLECYPSDLPIGQTTEIALTAMRCRFVAAAALLAMARTQDAVDQQLQLYLEMRHHIAAFDAALQMEAETQNETIIQDLVGKAAALFVFDFEGAVALKSWKDLAQIARKAKMCRDERIFKAMGDCLLRSKAPGRGRFKSSLLFSDYTETENQFPSLV